MPTAIEKILASAQSNCFPGMLEDLGRDLGVSANSLSRLGLGWMPIVPFKKGPSFCGWWVSAERDSTGIPTGLSLRNQDGVKVCYPGSKHGLIYEVNPNHKLGSIFESSDEHFIRTMDAGVLCPMCGKPDGCLVSSDDPSDPQAVCCIRTSTGAKKPLRFGYLHIRRSPGLGSSAALADNGGPLLIVEGMSDACAAIDLGFDAVGRPGNLACLDLLCDLARGRRDIIVVGENDLKSDGSHPGRQGMVSAWQMLKRVCPGVTMLMPPPQFKDLRDWKRRGELTHDGFLEYHATNKEQYAENLLLPDARPLTVARAYLNSLHRVGDRYTIRRWESAWWKYGGTKYVELPPEEFRQPMYAWSHDKQVEENEKLKPLICNLALINNLEDAMGSETLLTNGVIPCWINGATGPNPRNLISFNNGVVNVPSFLDGRSDTEYLLVSNPDLFTTVALPFAFDPLAKCPRWKHFLFTTLGDDPDKIKLLREWFGYCLTPDTSMHKLMYLRGPTGAGKSVILNLLCRLIGSDQAASTSFRDLCGDFGLHPLMGKQLCVIPDIRVSAKTDVMRGLEVLLNITAGDSVQINRKFKDAIPRHHLMSRIIIAGNDFIDVPDHAGAMIRRLNVIQFTKSFVGQEDWQLEDKLAEEIPGIAVWALAGLRDLRENQRFTLPESSKEALGEWRKSNSPMAAFLDECTEIDPKGEAGKEELFDCWSAWSEERRMAPISRSRFFERIRANAPHAIADSYDSGGHKFSVFRGLTLDRIAARKFLRAV